MLTSYCWTYTTEPSEGSCASAGHAPSLMGPRWLPWASVALTTVKSHVLSPGLRPTRFLMKKEQSAWKLELHCVTVKRPELAF